MTRNTIFGALRLFAALLVIYSHSFPIALGVNAPEPTLAGIAFGTIGVYLFFLISGMLVTKSLLNSKSVVHFVTYRLLRIYPGLIVCLMITTFVIGPIYSAATPSEYFSNIGIYEHFAHNGMLLTDVYSTLPRVFETNPLPLGINNSIWTLVWELRAYFLLLVGGFLVKRHWLGSALLFSASLLLAVDSRPWSFISTFFLGGLIYQVQAAYKIPGIRTTAFTILDKHDLSYGLYLYGFPIGQAIVYTLGIKEPIVLFLLTSIFAGIAASISWRFIESPALNNKHNVANSIERFFGGFVTQPK